ncbi:MAG: ThiF family adenylyltransferase [Candidatus Thermoplasmatota archaeon]|nr:ThiF family adenylyltransferase [Candidatus Thermoplasmatota archaeon]MBS3790309.1 ThiF family adenylyltransferase [Candidatus Thermoplasmatota archaeon]
MERYARHLVLPEIGQEGQTNIEKGTVAVFGLGALGSTITDALTRAGVGELKLIDRDFVELSNLNHQILFDEDDLGKTKAEVAEERVREINSKVHVEGKVTNIDSSNIEELISDVDLVMDGTDNLEVRYLTNDACVKHRIPWIYTAVLATYGMTKNIIPDENACLRCFFPEKPSAGSLETCETAGVLFTLPRIMGNIAATEAIKYLTGTEMRKGLLTFDVWDHDFEVTQVEKREEKCKACGERDFQFLKSEDETITELCGRNSVQITPAEEENIDLEELAGRSNDAKKMGDRMVKISTGDYQLNVFADGRAIIKGTEDPKKAKSLYSQYVGN